jgi:hypothetical protein
VIVKIEDLSERNEQIVREYFEGQGWSAKKLDPQGRKSLGRASDWKICHDNICFLCEVKTIYSVRANIPYTPVEYFIDKRKDLQTRVEAWKRSEPDKRLIMHREEYEFLYGDERDFRKKYQYRRRHTDYWFEREFAEPVQRYLTQQSSIRNLPYWVRLCSYGCYTPKPEERDDFCKWLEDGIRLIDEKGAPSWPPWVIDRRGPGVPAFYTAFYPIHKAAHTGDVEAEIQVLVVGPGKHDSLQVDIDCDGGLNLEAMTRNVEEARSQLKDTALREQKPTIARVVVLAFATGIDPSDWEELSAHIAWLLEEYHDLSAIAVLEWVPDGTLPPQEEGPLARLSFQAQAPCVPMFIVYHNSWLRNVEPLNTEAFDELLGSHSSRQWKWQA